MKILELKNLKVKILSKKSMQKVDGGDKEVYLVGSQRTGQQCDFLTIKL